jgi:aerobic carbon-monoxide dehydrogenase large subunit
MLDSGNYPEVLRRCLEIANYDDLRRQQQLAQKQGRYLGVGLSYELTPEGGCMPRSTMVSAYDGATVRMNAQGE